MIALRTISTLTLLPNHGELSGTCDYEEAVRNTKVKLSYKKTTGPLPVRTVESQEHKS